MAVEEIGSQYTSLKTEIRTARAARYSEALMVVGVISALGSKDQRKEVVPRRDYPFVLILDERVF